MLFSDNRLILNENLAQEGIGCQAENRKVSLFFKIFSLRDFLRGPQSSV
jgi:hypothetical protein